MPLKARKPELIEPKKPVIMVSGPSGSHKTTFALEFDKNYFFDVEQGATRPQYQEKLKKSGGAYFGKDEGAQDFNTVLEEVKELATTKHNFQTVTFDSFSHLYLGEAAEAELKGGSEYGRDKKEANKPTRQLMRWLDRIDMTVILICHAKPRWVSKGKERVQDGTTFDGYDKLEYLFDLWIETSEDGKTFTVRKSRIVAFPKGDSFPLSYNKFAELYGREIIEKATIPVKLANTAQLVQMEGLIKTLNITVEQQDKVLKTFDVDTWEECTEDQIQKAIESLQKKIKELTKEPVAKEK